MKEKKELILDGQKLWLLEHRDRLLAYLDGEKIAPITIDMSLAPPGTCYYKCDFCYAKLQKNPGKALSRDATIRFLDDAAEIGVKAVSFVSDGESTCSPHLYEAILRGRKNGLSMALGTAGYKLKEERLEDILPALTYLRFNFSAAAPERYAQIHGCKEECFYKVCQTIVKAVEIKKKNNLPVTIGLQMVLKPNYADQIVPIAKIGKDLGVCYTVIKHCSDDEMGSLAVNYRKYHDSELQALLREAESYSNHKSGYLVKAKWSKILAGNERSYSRCFGPPFFLQFSGTGLVAPCGMLFNERYKKYHVGNIAEQSFKKIWQSKKYWEVLGILASDKFDARTMCGCLCIQHKINEFLWELKKDKNVLKKCDKKNESRVIHRNFL